jgi:D-arabinose 1-dehydrogenase-like Zn-dependent alcohol dehydrogenase
MARSFWQGILAWFAGTVAGIIITAVIFKIGWENKEHILILGYGGLTSVGIMYVKFSNQIKKKEIEVIDEKLKGKADAGSVTILDEKIDSLHANLVDIRIGQKEIYNYLLFGKEGGKHNAMDSV